MNGAAAMVRCLEAEGITRIFGYPGVAIAPFYEEVFASGSIEHVLVRQEQAAGHAASGYARIARKPAVCVTSSGPGAANLITALATAYADSIPMVAITGQVNSSLLGRDVFQEADMRGATESFVKYSYLVKNPDDEGGLLYRVHRPKGPGPHRHSLRRTDGVIKKALLLSPGGEDPGL